VNYFVAHIYAEITPGSIYITVELPAQVDNTVTELSKIKLSNLTVGELLKPAIDEFATKHKLNAENINVNQYYIHLTDSMVPVAVCFSDGQIATAKSNEYIYGYYTPIVAPPLAPANFTGVLLPDYSGVRWTWSDILNEQKYCILDENNTILKELPKNSSEWIEPVTCNGRTIKRKVAGYNSAGMGIASTFADITLPSISDSSPYGLKGRCLSLSGILWSWNYTGPKGHYNLYDGITDELLKSFDSDNCSCTEIELVPGIYSRRLRVVTDEQTSEFTNEAVVVIPDTVHELKPSKPSLNGSASGPNSIVYQWIDNGNVDEFYICDEDGTILHNIPGGVGYFSEENLDTDITYRRRLQAYNEFGVSELSDIVFIQLVSMTFKPIVECPIEHNAHYIPQGRIKAFKSGVGDGLDLFVKGILTKANSAPIIDTMEQYLSDEAQLPVSAMASSTDWYVTDSWVKQYVDNLGHNCISSYTAFEIVLDVERKVLKGFNYYPVKILPYQFYTQGNYYNYDPGQLKLILKAIPEARAVIDVCGQVTDKISANIKVTSDVFYQSCDSSDIDYTVNINFDSIGVQRIVDDVLASGINWEMIVDDFALVSYTLKVDTGNKSYEITDREGIMYLWLPTITGTPQIAHVQIGNDLYINLTLGEILSRYIDHGGTIVPSNILSILNSAKITIYDDNFTVTWTGLTDITTDISSRLETLFDTTPIATQLGSYIFDNPVRLSISNDQDNKLLVYSLSKLLKNINTGQRLEIIEEYSDGSSRNINHLVEFTSSHPNIAIVTSDGVVYGMSPGETNIAVGKPGQGTLLWVHVTINEYGTVTISTAAESIIEPVSIDIIKEPIFSSKANEILPLSELEEGDQFIFSGRVWILLEEVTTYDRVILKTPLAPMAFDNDVNDKYYNPDDSDNIAYYLNHTFYNTFTVEEKGLLINPTFCSKVELPSAASYKELFDNVYKNIPSLWSWSYGIGGRYAYYPGSPGENIYTNVTSPCHVVPQIYLNKTMLVEKVDTSIVLVDSITLNISSLYLEIGRYSSPGYEMLPTNPTDRSVTWSSSNTSIATVDSITGRIKAVGVGTCNITITANDASHASDSMSVTVIQGPPGYVRITDFRAGDEFIFSGRSWIFVNHPDSTSCEAMLKTPLPPMAFDKSPGDEVEYIPTDPDNVAYYLNNNFYNTFTTDEQNLILIADDYDADYKITIPDDGSDLMNLVFKDIPSLWIMSGRTTTQGIFCPSTSYGEEYYVNVDELHHVVPVIKLPNTLFVEPVIVPPVLPRNIVLNVYELSLRINEVFTLEYDVYPIYTTDKSITWYNANPDIVNIDQNRVITAIHAGSGYISLTCNADTNVNTGIYVTVLPPDPVAIPITNMYLNQEMQSLRIDQTHTLMHTILPVDATNKILAWSSDNTNVATVDSNGVVRGVSIGTCIITARTSDGSYLNDTCIITVTTAVISFSLNLSSYTFGVYPANLGIDTMNVYYSITPSDATNKNIIWSSSDESIATVAPCETNYSRVTARNYGQCIITGTTEDGGLTDSIVVTIVDPTIHVTNVWINPEYVDTVSNQSYITLSLGILPFNAADRSVTWSTSNSNVAVPDPNVSGRINIIGPGECTITVRTNDGGLTDSSIITVTPAIYVTGITLTPDRIDTNIGQSSVMLTATVSPSNATNKSITWSTSNSNVVVPDSAVSGKVNITGPGECLVTVRTDDGGFTDSSLINVDSRIPVTWISVAPGIATLSRFETQALTATIYPTNATNKNVRWSSDNPIVATVDDNGIVTGAWYGYCTIIATTEDGEYTDTCVVSIPYIGITNIETEYEAIYCNITESVNLFNYVNIYPANATEQIVWHCDIPGIISIDEYGNITCISGGSVRITGTCTNGTQVSFEFTVDTTLVPTLVRVIAVPASITLPAGVGVTIPSYMKLNVKGVTLNWTRKDVLSFGLFGDNVLGWWSGDIIEVPEHHVKTYVSTISDVYDWRGPAVGPLFGSEINGPLNVFGITVKEIIANEFPDIDQNTVTNIKVDGHGINNDMVVVFMDEDYVWAYTTGQKDSCHVPYRFAWSVDMIGSDGITTYNVNVGPFYSEITKCNQLHKITGHSLRRHINEKALAALKASYPNFNISPLELVDVTLTPRMPVDVFWKLDETERVTVWTTHETFVSNYQHTYPVILDKDIIITPDSTSDNPLNVSINTLTELFIDWYNNSPIYYPFAKPLSYTIAIGSTEWGRRKLKFDTIQPVPDPEGIWDPNNSSPLEIWYDGIGTYTGQATGVECKAKRDEDGIVHVFTSNGISLVNSTGEVYSGEEVVKWSAHIQDSNGLGLLSWAADNQVDLSTLFTGVIASIWFRNLPGAVTNEINLASSEPIEVEYVVKDQVTIPWSLDVNVEYSVAVASSYGGIAFTSISNPNVPLSSAYRRVLPTESIIAHVEEVSRIETGILKSDVKVARINGLEPFNQNGSGWVPFEGVCNAPEPLNNWFNVKYGVMFPDIVLPDINLEFFWNNYNNYNTVPVNGESFTIKYYHIELKPDGYEKSWVEQILKRTKENMYCCGCAAGFDSYGIGGGSIGGSIGGSYPGGAIGGGTGSYPGGIGYPGGYPGNYPGAYPGGYPGGGSYSGGYYTTPVAPGSIYAPVKPWISPGGQNLPGGTDISWENGLIRIRIPSYPGEDFDINLNTDDPNIEFEIDHIDESEPGWRTYYLNLKTIIPELGRWNPLIKSGYYYLGSDEYYLFVDTRPEAKPIVIKEFDTESIKLEIIFETDAEQNADSQVIGHVVENFAAGVTTGGVIINNENKSLTLNQSNTGWQAGIFTSDWISVSSGIQEWKYFEAKGYIPQGSLNTEVRFKVNGEISNWYLIANGTKPLVPMGTEIQYRLIMQQGTIQVPNNTEFAWDGNMLSDIECHNVVINDEGYITAQDLLSDMVLISNPISSESLSKFIHKWDILWIDGWVPEGSILELNTSTSSSIMGPWNEWVLVDDVTGFIKSTQEPYIKWKVVARKGDGRQAPVIERIVLGAVATMEDIFPPYIGSVRIELSRPQGIYPTDVKINKSAALKTDGLFYDITEGKTLKQMVDEYIYLNEAEYENVRRYRVFGPVGVEFRYDSNGTTSVHAAIKEVRKIDVTITDNFVLDTANEIEVYPVPRQGAPIVVYDNREEPLRQVFFTDSDGKPTLINTEIIIGDGTNRVDLAHMGIDPNSLDIAIDWTGFDKWESVDIEDVILYDSIIWLAYKVSENTKIRVRYCLTGSFYVDYNYKPENDLIKIKVYDPVLGLDRKIKVYYETNNWSSYYKAEEVNLNPIMSIEEGRFLFISDRIPVPTTIDIHVSPDTLLGNGIDQASIFAIVRDEFGNPIPHEPVSFTSTDGVVTPANTETNFNGVAIAKYIVPSKVITQAKQIVIKAHATGVETSKVVKLSPEAITGKLIITGPSILSSGVATLTITGTDGNYQPLNGDIKVVIGNKIHIYQLVSGKVGVEIPYETIPNKNKKLLIKAIKDNLITSFVMYVV